MRMITLVAPSLIIILIKSLASVHKEQIYFPHINIAPLTRCIMWDQNSLFCSIRYWHLVLSFWELHSCTYIFALIFTTPTTTTPFVLLLIPLHCSPCVPHVCLRYLSHAAPYTGTPSVSQCDRLLSSVLKSFLKTNKNPLSKTYDILIRSTLSDRNAFQATQCMMCSLFRLQAPWSKECGT